jgi:hypothetical protein
MPLIDPPELFARAQQAATAAAGQLAAALSRPDGAGDGGDT